MQPGFSIRFKTPLGLTAGIAIALGMMSCPNVGWASVSICTSSAVTLASFGATDTGDGCINADQSFSNFATSSAAGPTLTNSDNKIAATNTFSSVSTPWTVTDLFTPVAASDWETSGASGNLAAGITVLTDSQQNYITNPFYPPPDPGHALFLTSLKLIATGSTGNGTGVLGDNMSMSADFCIGNNACTNPNFEVQLSADWGQNTSTVTAYTCSVGASVTAYFSCGSSQSDTPITVTFLQAIATVTVEDGFNMVTNKAGTTDQLISFANVWGGEELPIGSESPEPSTFVMLGAGIAGMALLRSRRKGRVSEVTVSRRPNFSAGKRDYKNT